MGTKFRALRCGASGRDTLRSPIPGFRLEQGLAFDGITRPALRVPSLAQRVYRPLTSFAQRRHFQISRLLPVSKVSPHIQFNFPRGVGMNFKFGMNSRHAGAPNL
jgi:hypothetical protein